MVPFIMLHAVLMQGHDGPLGSLLSWQLKCRSGMSGSTGPLGKMESLAQTSRSHEARTT